MKRYPNYFHIYTDGQKHGNRTGCRATKKRLPQESSIFTAETFAIELVLNIVSTSNAKRFIIHSDSFSVLSLIKNKKVDNPPIINLLNSITSITHNKKVIFCWIPSYIGIQGNHKANSIAKSAFDMISDKNSE